MKSHNKTPQYVIRDFFFLSFLSFNFLKNSFHFPVGSDENIIFKKPPKTLQFCLFLWVHAFEEMKKLLFH